MALSNGTGRILVTSVLQSSNTVCSYRSSRWNDPPTPFSQEKRYCTLINNFLKVKTEMVLYSRNT